MTRTPRVRLRLVGLAAALLLFAADCGGSASGESRTAACGNGQGTAQQVPLRVLQGSSGATVALVPVSLDGKGPFAFALDTGAARSVVGRSVLNQLNVKTLGKTKEPIAGIVGKVRATKVRITRWRAGEVKLPEPEIVLSIPLADQTGGGGPQGLLGSDILSSFGSITVDYQHQMLILCTS
ncbi:MAG TPA: aspartyl protease family protein [Actinomycetota bacterium]|jgi:hypothetical protein|nr:aspartyl protease family protein [Actinomycetota bacterium]